VKVERGHVEGRGSVFTINLAFKLQTKKKKKKRRRMETELFLPL
jgi:hypothetical protein